MLRPFADDLLATAERRIHHYEVNDGGGSGLVAWPVFKTAMETPPAAPVGSIPTRSRHAALRGRVALWHRACAAAAVLLLCIAAAGSATAQDSARVVLPADSTAPQRAPSGSAADSADGTARAPAAPDAPRGARSPGGALIRSLLVPGWGQIALGRKLTAAVFLVAEAATVTMVVRKSRELSDARASGDATLIDDKSRQREDWFVLAGVNHVLAGIEAYVSAHLADFPRDLHVRAVPGGAAARLSLPFRIR